MAHQIEPEMWSKIREFCRSLSEDPRLTRQFEANPAEVLGEQELDVSFPEKEVGHASLGAFLIPIPLAMLAL